MYVHIMSITAATFVTVDFLVDIGFAFHHRPFTISLVFCCSGTLMAEKILRNVYASSNRRGLNV